MKKFLLLLAVFSALVFAQPRGTPPGDFSIVVQFPDGQSFPVLVPGFALDLSGPDPQLNLALGSGTSFPTNGLKLGQAFIRTDQTSGQNFYILTDLTGPVWTQYGGGAVSSVFTRTGAVTAQSGDYSSNQLGDFAFSISNAGATLNVAAGTFAGNPIPASSFTFVLLPVSATDGMNPATITVPGITALLGSSGLQAPFYVAINGGTGCFTGTNSTYLIDSSPGTDQLLTDSFDATGCGGYVTNSAVAGQNTGTDDSNPNALLVSPSGVFLLDGDSGDGLLFSVTGSAFYLQAYPIAQDFLPLADSFHGTLPVWTLAQTWFTAGTSLPPFINTQNIRACAGCAPSNTPGSIALNTNTNAAKLNNGSTTVTLGTIVSTTDLIAGDGAGNGVDSGIPSIGSVGSNIIGLGANALYGNSGTDVVGIGDTPLNENTGSDVVAVGDRAAANYQSGSNVVAIGNRSVTSNMGSDVVAIGDNAGNDLNTGNNIVLIGNSPGLNNVSNYLVAVGAFTDQGHRAGDSNIFLGDVQSGTRFPGSQKALDHSIVIGPDTTTQINNSGGTQLTNIAAINGTATGSNQTVIGNPSTTDLYLYGNLDAPHVIPPTVVGSLGSCASGNEGQRWGVTDALTPTALAPVMAGGMVHVPVYCDGTNWIVQ